MNTESARARDYFLSKSVVQLSLTICIYTLICAYRFTFIHVHSNNV